MHDWFVLIYHWILEHKDAVGLLLDFVSLVVGIILTVGIFLMERHHTKMREYLDDQHQQEREKLEERAKREAISEAARIFIIDNDEELGLLPLCQVAAQLALKTNHKTKIITRFIRCSSDVQSEILRQANIPVIHITLDLINNIIDKIDAKFKQENFGQALLYGGAKYYHRALRLHSSEDIDNIDPHIFPSNGPSAKSALKCFPNYKVSLSSYIYDYLECSNSEVSNSMVPPNTMLYATANLGSCDESIVTFWIMRLLVDSCGIFYSVYGADYIDEGTIKTQEEMYYYTALVLYQTYLAISHAA